MPLTGIWLTVVCSKRAVALRGCHVVTLTLLLGVLLSEVTLLVHVVTLLVTLLVVPVVVLSAVLALPGPSLGPWGWGISRLPPAERFSLLALGGHTMSVMKTELELSLCIVSSSSCCSDLDLWLGVQ